MTHLYWDIPKKCDFLSWNVGNTPFSYKIDSQEFPILLQKSQFFFGNKRNNES